MRFIYLILISFLGLSSATTAVAENNVLRIHGSNTVGAALIPELVGSWLQTQGYTVTADRETAKEERKIIARKGDAYLNVEIQAHGSSTAFKALENAQADLGMSSRPVKKKEVLKLLSLGRLDSAKSEYIIAIDGLAVIVNKQNPVKQLSVNQVRDIYSGKIKNWSELGGSSGDISVHARDDKSGTYDTFKSLVLGKNAPLTPQAKRYESNSILSSQVSADINAIGFVGLAYVKQSRALAISDEEANALMPTAFNVSTEDYALSRRLYLYLPEKNRHPLAESLAEFARSDAGQRIAQKVGFVSQEVVSYKPQTAQAAPQQYLDYIKNAERLSLNIRFKKGQSYLDNKAAHDIKRLIHFMEKSGNENKRVMLFGFADNNEVIPYMSLSLSIERADVIANRLLHKHIIPSRVRGYGAVMPVASNATERGRTRNRRVEVWVESRK